MAVGGYYPVEENGDILYCPDGTVPITLEDGTLWCQDPLGVRTPPRREKNPNPKNPFPPLPPGPVPKPPAGPPSRSEGGRLPPTYPVAGPTLGGGFTENPTPSPSGGGGSTSSESNIGIGPGALAIANATATAIDNSVNQFSIANSIDTGPIGDAITSGIGDLVNQISDAQVQTAKTIQASITNFSSSLFGFVTDIGKWIAQHIKDVLDAIASKLSDIASAVYNTVVKAVQSVVTIFQNTVKPIFDTIAADIRKVVDFYQQHIQPILVGVSQAVGAIAATEKAIQADLHAGISGLLQLPTDIANGLQQLDQALIRAGRALKVHKAEDADFYFVTSDGRGFADHLRSIGDAVIGLGTVKQKTTYQPGKENLSEPTLAQELPPLLNSVYTILSDICKGLKSTTQDWTGILELLGIAGTGFALSVVSPFVLLGTALAMVRGPFNVVSELAEQRAFQAAPIRKLEATELVEAVRRKFIDARQMDAELALQGYDANRSDLLRQLGVFLEPASTLVDYLYRQIITDDDFAAGLGDLGYTPDQIAAAKEASNRILDVQDILTAWRRNEADEKTVDDTLRANRFTDAQGQLLKALAFAPAGFSAAYRYALVHRFLNFDNLPLPTLDEIPQVVKDAGRADGLSDDAILIDWTSRLNTLEPSQWVALYFKNQAKLEEVNAALLRERVPQELWTNWIDSQRPLIPFRTIPSMIKSGLLTPAQGLQKLQAHGYTLEDATLLIEYAGASAQKGRSAIASTQHEVSIAVGKSLYMDGAISRDQFAAILKAHGFDDANVALEIQLTDIQDHAAARRALGTDVVNEFQAGMLTHDEAVSRLEQSNLTQAEQAKYIKSLKASKLSKVKLPSEPELRQMAIHGIISVDDYTTNLVGIGYSADWAARFTALHFGSGGNPAVSSNAPLGG